MHNRDRLAPTDIGTADLQRVGYDLIDAVTESHQQFGRQLASQYPPNQVFEETQPC